MNQNPFSRFLQKIKTFFLTNPKKIIFILFVVILGFFYFGNSGQKIEVGHLENGNLQEVVSVSGTVNPTQESSLSFEKAGRIQSINVKVGDKVYAGQILASLAGGVDYAGVLNAKAQLEAAEANLQDAQNGPSATDLAVKQGAVDSALINLNADYNSASDEIRSVNTTLTDLLGNKLGNFFSSLSYAYRLNFNSCDQSLQSKIETQRFALDPKLSSLSNIVNSNLYFNISESSQATDANKIDSISKDVYDTVVSVSNTLDDLNNLLTSSCSISDTSLDKYRLAISSARSSISTLISDINSLKSKINNDRNTLSLAQNSLNQIKAGSTPERIKSLKALVNQSKANLVSAEAVNSKNYISAPFAGVVTAVNINLGEISSPNSNAINIMSYSDLELKIKLAEVDLIKVKVGDKADVYLDSYGDGVVFHGVVGGVDPAATAEGNSSTYFAKIVFNTADDRIRSGMNGSAKIITEEKLNTDYILPQYLKVEGSINKVKAIKDISKLEKTSTDDNDPNIEWKNISIGIRGEDGKIEVLSGISSADNLCPIGTEVLSSTSTNK